MKISVNGETREIIPGLTVRGMLSDLGIDVALVAVEYNGRLLDKDEYQAVLLNSGDVLEIVRFVGGG